jgi:hypothetical protein
VRGPDSGRCNSCIAADSRHCRRGRNVTTFPQRSRAPAARIELPDVVMAKFLHEAGNGTAVGRSDQQVDVIAHQHVRRSLDGGIDQSFMQHVQVAPPVVVVQEARQAIVTALDHMLRYPRQIETRRRAMRRVSSQRLKMERVDR